jgi:hypothetical protein
LSLFPNLAPCIALHCIYCVVQDGFRELFVTTIFTVAVQVVPVLLRLNRGPVWLTLLLVYPLYTYGVDSAGRASTLSPSILLALAKQSVVRSLLSRCFAQMLGGVLAGQIMLVYFPDDDKRAK